MPKTRSETKPHRSLIVAIVGGSGSGKSWLADKLQLALGKLAARLSLDDFYIDRSHLPMHRRARINFDHPRAVDWAGFEKVLRTWRSGKRVQSPCYDFETHSRLRKTKSRKHRPILLVDGLWLLRRPAVRRIFDLRLFLDCSAKLRFQRRVARDRKSRGRTLASIRQQFRRTVEPMHAKFIAPQVHRADVVVRKICTDADIQTLASQLRARLNESKRFNA